MIHANYSGRVVLEMWRCQSKRWMTKSMEQKNIKFCNKNENQIISISLRFTPYFASPNPYIFPAVSPQPQPPTPSKNAHFEDIQFLTVFYLLLSLSFLYIYNFLMLRATQLNQFLMVVIQMVALNLSLTQGRLDAASKNTSARQEARRLSKDTKNNH